MVRNVRTRPECHGNLSKNYDSLPIKRAKTTLNDEKIICDDIENRHVCKSWASFKNYRQCHIVKYYTNYETGFSRQNCLKPSTKFIINYCKTFQLRNIESPFERRVTFLLWHPYNPRLLSVSTHFGDIILYNCEQDINSATLLKGIGPGGSVQGMDFNPNNPLLLYAASMEGTFMEVNFETKEKKTFVATNDINRWYISAGVSINNQILVAGDTRGNITLLSLQGEVIDTLQIHKTGFKVSHTEFSKRETWLLCTTSTDSSVKLWDIRFMKKSQNTNLVKPLQTITHEKPINAGYFSLTDGCRLLTSDQKDKINIYRAPLWNLETEIHHPHRQFQHLTPMRAYWHPLDDIVFIGRYPHKEFPGYHINELRTIDFFDANTGDLLYQHHQSGINGLMSLNRFNVTGDTLASSFGTRFLIWKPNFQHLEKLSKKKERKSAINNGNDNDDDSDDDDDDDDENHNNEYAKNNSNDNGIDWKNVLKNQKKEKRTEKKIQKKKKLN